MVDELKAPGIEPAEGLRPGVAVDLIDVVALAETFVELGVRDLLDASDEYLNSLGCELERVPWSRPTGIAVWGDRFAESVANFTTAAGDARALIEGRR